MSDCCANKPTPAKPWERSRQGGAPPTATGNPGDALPKPWERPAGASNALATSQAGAVGSSASNALAAPTQPPRPWERAGSTYNSNASSTGPYNSTPYNSLPYNGNSYGTYGGGYQSPYAGSYGGSSLYGSSSMVRPYGMNSYGSSVGGYGSSVGGYGTGYNRPGYGGYGSYGGGPGAGYGSPYASPYGIQGPPNPYDPNDPNGPPQPPTAWQQMLRGISGVVHFFGRLSFLVDENAQAIHFFISALLQLLDRAGSLYGELGRFVLRVLGYKGKGKQAESAKVPGQPGLPALPAPNNWENMWPANSGN